MKKRAKTKIISILTVLAMLICACLAFTSCSGGTTETLKYNIQITGENGEILCNLTDVELTGADLTVLSATQNACEVIELGLGLDDTGKFVEQIGTLKNGVQGGTEAPVEAQTDENGEEVTTEATEAVQGDYYFWEVSVGGTVLETGPAEFALTDGANITWKWVIFTDETAG